MAREIFEYPDRPELGIRGSDRDNWVPADWALVRADQAIEGAVGRARGFRDKALQLVERVRAVREETVTNRQKGLVYRSESARD